PALAVLPPPSKSGTALYEGTWRVTTIPTNTPSCYNLGRDMNLRIDATGRITDMCVWTKATGTCGPSFATSIRKRTVSDKGAFEFSYVVVPHLRDRPHENRLRGSLNERSGSGEVTAWRNGARTPCPPGHFTASRID